MIDWEFVKNYTIHGWWKRFLTRGAQLPCLGKLFKKLLYERLSLSYDISVNFVEAHEVANKMIHGIIHSEEFVNIVVEEAQKNIWDAEKYISTEIENVFPEISKSI